MKADTPLCAPAPAPARPPESSAGLLPPLLLTDDGSARLLDTSPDPVIGLGSELTDRLPHPPGPHRDAAVVGDPVALHRLGSSSAAVKTSTPDWSIWCRLARALADLDLEDVCDAHIEQLDHHGEDDTALIACAPSRKAPRDLRSRSSPPLS